MQRVITVHIYVELYGHLYSYWMDIPIQDNGISMMEAADMLVSIIKRDK